MPGSLPAKCGGSVTTQGCLIADIAPAIKPRMCRKCGTAQGHIPVINCPKPETNRIRPLLAPSRTAPALMQWQASRRTVMLGALLAASGLARSRAWAADANHAIAMHGEPAWAANFSHPSYADPAAPKGGQLVQGVLGTFDSVNSFIVKGLPAVNIRGYVIESLLARGYDELFTLYGPVSYTHLRAHETVLDLVCRL